MRTRPSRNSVAVAPDLGVSIEPVLANPPGAGGLGGVSDGGTGDGVAVDKAAVAEVDVAEVDAREIPSGDADEVVA